MLIISNDPAGITGRERHEWDYSASMQANIARHVESGHGCELFINGLQVDPLTDLRLDRCPSIADTVIVSRRPAGYEWIYYAVVAVLAVYSYSMIPKIPASTAGNDSPNNQLTGQTNIARTYQGIPDVYGLRRVWPDLIQASTIEYVSNVKFVTEWLCISRGKGTISDVHYAETPIEDISGASFEIFEPAPSSGYPEDSTTTLTDVIETFASPEVNGQELYYAGQQDTSGQFESVSGGPGFSLQVPDGAELTLIKEAASVRVVFDYTGGSFDQVCTLTDFDVVGDQCVLFFDRASGTWSALYEEAVNVFLTPIGDAAISVGPFTLPVNGDRLRWNTVFQRGLKGSVQIEAEWWKVDGAGVEISGTRQTQSNTFTANTYDQRFYTTEVTPSAGFGRYRIQFTRLTPKIGDGGSDVAKLEELFAVRYYAEKVLPGVTVIRLTTQATTEATGYSDRKFNLRWLRHVRALSSDALSPSRNFARAMAHIWTIAGNDIAGLDVDAMAAINAEHGEDSALLRFDSSLDDANMSLGERLQLVANNARCVVWRDGLKWTVTRDQARPYPELQLDYRNLASGGESSISYASHLPASNDGVEVEYVDQDTQSKKAYVRLDISSGTPVPGLSRNPKKFKLAGCTTLAQADNRAQLEARRLIYSRVSVSDTSLSDGLALGPGSLVRWIDPNDFAGDDGLQAGEVLAVSGDMILTSEPVDWKGESSGRILFTGVDGRHLGAPVACYPSGEAIRLASVPTGIYVADPDRQCGSRYAFAVGLTAAEIEGAGLFTATEIKPAGDRTCSLSLAAYDARIYEADT